MISVECDLCHEPLEEQGALLFSPPDSDGVVVKFHICIVCWPSVYGLVEEANL